MAAAGLKPLGSVIGINSCPGNSSCKIQFNHIWWRVFSLSSFPHDFPKRPKKLIYPGWKEKYINNFTFRKNWMVHVFCAQLRSRVKCCLKTFWTLECIILLCLNCTCHEEGNVPCSILFYLLLLMNMNLERICFYSCQQSLLSSGSPGFICTSCVDGIVHVLSFQHRYESPLSHLLCPC